MPIKLPVERENIKDTFITLSYNLLAFNDIGKHEISKYQFKGGPEVKFERHGGGNIYHCCDIEFNDIRYTKDE